MLMCRALWEAYKVFSAILVTLVLFSSCVLSGIKLPASPDGTATERTYQLAAPWCPRAVCTGLAEWQTQVSDGRILGALIVAYHYAPQWRQLAQASAKRGTRIVVGKTMSSQGGYYDPRSNVVTISDGVVNESTSVLAAIVAHEVYHARTSSFTRGSADCIEEETAAHLWAAHVWDKVKLGNEHSHWAETMNTVQYRVEQGSLNAYVIQIPGYQEECLGRVIEDH